MKRTPSGEAVSHRFATSGEAVSHRFRIETRAAFTLLELLTVIGLMAMLGVAASNGYRALARGMRERGAVAAASAALRAARERALVDRQHTIVFCYNRMLREPNPNADVNGVVVGAVTAIRCAGRISGIRGNLLYDEFADLDRVYRSTDQEAECAKYKGLRLFRFEKEMKYSIVSEAVLQDKPQAYVPSDRDSTEVLLTAFCNLHRSQHEPQWKIGDRYALEFLDIELPEGFVFGKNLPTKSGEIVVVEKFEFDPDQKNNVQTDIYFTAPNESGMPTVKGGKAGTATSRNDAV